MFIQEMDASALQAQLTSGRRPRLVDVRSPAEMARGTLPEAEQLPLHLLPLRADEIPREETVILYCRSGARSAQACSYLMTQGYDNVVNLRGGIISWLRHGFPLVNPSHC